MKYVHAQEVRRSSEAAAAIVKVVASLIGIPKSMVDVGGGTGAWSNEFKKAGVAKVICIDHASASSNGLLIEKAEFIPVDLAAADPPPHATELAVCVEVGEHLPTARSRWLVDYLTRCAEIALFSAAVPGQGGVNHINEQWPDYWHDLFAARGYAVQDTIRPKIVNDPSIPFWYRQNLFLYTKAAAEPAAFLPKDFYLVHKTSLKVLENPTFKTLLSKLPSAFARMVRHRFGGG